MQYPTVSPPRTSRETLDVFKGYHRSLCIGEGEFYDMENLSSDHYPLLSPRAPRGVYATPGMAQGMIAKDELCYVDGSDLMIGEKRVPMGLTADGKPKTLASMGAYVVILPDKKYVNTADPEDCGPIEASAVTFEKTEILICDTDGTPCTGAVVQEAAPEEPLNGDLWVDISQAPHVLKIFNFHLQVWGVICKTRVRLESPGIGAPFAVEDGVSISGILWPKSLNCDAVVHARGDDFIVIDGSPAGNFHQSGPVTVERRMPELDFVIESENRLWGCRYGEGVNRIYASKLGDFKNWNCLMGTAADSYSESVGTDGAFTGAVVHLGYPLFFKENCVHKIYGSFPYNFQVRTTLLRGVQSGCSRSLAAVGETLYYKSRAGVCAYDGSLPEEISEKLGAEAYGNAAAGSLGNKYYISMSDTEGNYHTFVYDTVKRLWHREDGTRATEFCTHRGELYYIDYATEQIRTVKGTGVREEDRVRWSATTGIIGTDSPDKKYVSRMDVRMKLAVGARVTFYAEYDSSGEYEYLFAMTGKTLQSFSVPIRPKRCDHLRLRIVGEGEAKIFSICKTVEKGSAL